MADKFWENGPPVWDVEIQGTAASGAAVSVDAATFWLIAIAAVNTHATDDALLSITDGADFPTVDTEPMVSKGRFEPPEYPLKKMTNGVKIGAVGGTVKYHIWGYRGV